MRGRKEGRRPPVHLGGRKSLPEMGTASFFGLRIGALPGASLLGSLVQLWLLDI